ncbi:MAG: serine protein kinase [Chloroflexi bacterium]|nr:serine protein kinase [Ardenticatenaceae bacterium]MBL1128009.1 serine protein kinase [Chloroflexota bacterium]NOG34081.1 serine protein kinase [Chloroflexota bacterium]GIK54499.1 MAG: serine protein kinase [Chloroflexota bacterium]
MKKNDIMARIASLQDLTNFRNLHWEGSFAEYLDIVRADPRVARTAYQRLYDMIISYGSEEYSRNREKLIHYYFFDDPFENGKDAVFGIDKQLMDLVQIFRSAAHRYGTERRVILLHGPVGTAKSTIVRLLKKGLEHYTRLDDGRLYSFRWEPTDGEPMDCPMHEDPLHLIPPQFREAALEELNDGRTGMERITIEGDLCPACRFIFNQLLEQADGDWAAVINQVKVKRILLSEKDRVGIGTFQPKDEKNQDSTELTGDINYRKIAEYGSDSDPRAFNFDGELNIANRGLVEFIEILKLDVAFLYDLLTASQEHKIKPKKFAHTDIDEVILGHTNEAEYRRLLNNEYMEALRDRTIKIDIPYNIRFQDEVKIYQRDFSQEKVIGKHIAPHTLQLAAFWAILTRLEEPKRAGISLVQKLRLYDGRSLPGFTEDTVIELQEESAHEGMFGISPRYIQDKISNALVGDSSRSCLNPFMIMRELESGLRHHSLITSKEQRKQFRDLLSVVRAEYDEIVKNEVQRAITADEEAIKRLSANYIDNVKAYTQKQKVRNPYTGQDEPPDERLMRAIEEKIEIPESRKDDFRREIMNYIGALAIDGKQFTWDSNERLRRALELKLFEDQKDSIKLTSLVSNVIDQETQEKIEVVKSRMIKNMGYCEICATDVLNYVASIFARGDTQQRS